MPRHEYQCQGGGGHIFERTVSFDQADTIHCETHPTASTKRLFPRGISLGGQHRTSDSWEEAQSMINHAPSLDDVKTELKKTKSKLEETIAQISTFANQSKKKKKH